MGLVKFGGLVTQVSGAIAGVVFARNRSGSYIRPRTKPVNPHSARQEAARAVVSFLAEYWHSDMTPVQRAAWEVYASAVAMKNRLGETIYNTGYNHFIRCNCFLQLLVPGSTQPTASLILNLPEKDVTTLCSEEGVIAQTFTFTFDATGWGVTDDDKSAMAFYQGIPQLASRNFFAGPWRYMDFCDNTEGATGTHTVDAAYPFGVGQKVWFQARLRDGDGRCSDVWTLSPRTIIADV